MAASSAAPATSLLPSARRRVPSRHARAADQGTHRTGSQETEREGARRYAALPAELIDDGWKEQRKRRARVDADRHGDERHGDHDPAVKEGKPHWVSHLVIPGAREPGARKQRQPEISKFRA